MARAWLRLQFTFTHPDDVAKFGDQPFLYDERELAGLPARELADLEEQFNMSIVDVINGIRDNRALADLYATWWALRDFADRPALVDYSPHTVMIEWGAAPEEGPGKEKASRPILSANLPDPTSEDAPMITLPSLPKAG